MIWGKRALNDLDEEIRDHIERETQDNLARGLSPEKARQAAYRKFGSVTLAKENARAVWVPVWLDQLRQDLEYGIRGLQRNPGFAAVAILTLALGIGANTTIFSLVDHIFFRPFAYQHPEQLAAVHEVLRFSGATRVVPVNLVHFQEWRRNWQAVEGLAVIGGLRMSLTGVGEPERLQTMRVSANLFSLLGVQSQLGRTFTLEDDQVGRDHVVVLSDDFWRRRFNADPSVIGRSIALNGEPYEVVGILPHFSFPKVSELFPFTIATTTSPQIWKPLGALPAELTGGDFNFACIARLKPDVSLPQALSTLNNLQQTLPQRVSGATLRANLVPLEDQVAGRVRSGLSLIWAAVGAVLLIGCVNMTNLLLARTLSRRREMTIRTAIGASRGRLMRQVLVESVLLSVIGGIVGVVAAYFALHVIVSAAPADLPRVNEIQIDRRVMTFTVCVSLMAGVLVGLLPAWRLGVLSPIDALKSGSASVTSARSTGRLRTLLVAGEVGVSALCLIAGGLLLHSFSKLLQVDAGFAASRVTTVDVSLPIQRYATPVSRSTFIRTALEQLQALPGVVAAGVSSKLPLTGEGGNAALWPERSTAVSESILGDIRPVNPDYFRAMSIPWQQGQLFGESDRDKPVAVVSAVAAARLWPGEDPISKQFHIGAPSLPPIQVVGTVGDIHGVSLDRPPSPTVYVPYWQSVLPPGVNSMDLVVVARTTEDPMTVSSSIRRLIRQLDPELAVPAVRTMDDVVTDSFEQRRFQMALVLLFAAVGTLLAGLGIYGVISYSVAQLTHEMGIRLALGAESRRVRNMVLTQGMKVALAGISIGMASAFGLARLLTSFLFGVTPNDPVVFATVPLVLSLAALAAVWLPARRATKVDPLVALRCD